MAKKVFDNVETGVEVKIIGVDFWKVGGGGTTFDSLAK